MRTLCWELKHPRATYEMLGYIPQFLSADDPRPAKEQFEARYVSGWPVSRQGWRLLKNGLAASGEVHPLIAEARLRDETIRLYNGAWVAVIQADGSFEVARID